MTGTIINTAAIIAGGVSGHLFGRFLKERHQETLTMACGVSTIFLSVYTLRADWVHSFEKEKI